MGITALDSNIFDNQTGFTMQALVDLQKLVCCFSIAHLEHQSEPVTNVHRVHFRAASTCSDVSSRVTLALRQSQAWKYLVWFGLVWLKF